MMLMMQFNSLFVKFPTSILNLFFDYISLFSDHLQLFFEISIISNHHYSIGILPTRF